MKLRTLSNECDALLVTSPHNMRYLSGFSGGEGVCLIGEDFNYIFVDSRYTVAAKNECDGFEVIEYSSGKKYQEILSRLVKHSVKALGFENTIMTVSEYTAYDNKLENIKMCGLNNTLDLFRMVKSDEEIALLRQAEAIGDRAFEHILPLLKEGVSENDIAAEIEYQMRRHGASGTSFDTIVVSGKKSAMPHGKPDCKKLERGDFVTMDFGCVYKGYCSDMTRTVVIGEASEEQKKIYDTVLKAQKVGLSAIKSGVLGKNADAAARSVIDEAGYGKYFGHSLGHGVGLLVHESPSLSPLSDIVLEENMVVTCEPGIYIEGFGGVRIEDMVVVKDNGIENLASSPKELIVCG